MAIRKKRASKSLYRSGYEEKVTDLLRSEGIAHEYETIKLNYTIPASKHSYTPDIILSNGVIVETKGYLDSENFLKMTLVIQQNPHLDIRICFQQPNNKIRKGSKTTYGMKCDKLGIKWGTVNDILAWSKE